ncbi:MAG TPA: hypothetical protein DHV12_04065 [Thermotogae bacterium]|nr:hypothetical protein [Thermotogota bacterium]
MGLGGYYWWGTELDFQIPTLGSLEFDKPMVYGGPGFGYVNTGGLANAFAVNFSGELLIPIKSFQFTLFGMNIQPALGMSGEIGYWITGAAGYGYSGLYSNAEPKISFLTIPEKPGALRWYGFFWPFPLIIGVGAYN